MATDYHGIRAPFTAIRVIEGVGTRIIVMEVGDEVAGDRRCSIPDLPRALLLFAASAVLATRGASGIGYVPPHLQHLPDSLQLISEYGDLTTLGEVRRGVAP